MLKNFIYVMALTCFITKASAQKSIALDSTFGSGGIVYNVIADDTFNQLYQTIIQADGKIIAVGATYLNKNDTTSEMAIARYNVNGTLDSTFNKTGYNVTIIDSSLNSYLASVVVQPNGKILAFGGIQIAPDTGFYPGPRRLILIRYNSDGTLDTTFNHGKIDTTSVKKSGFLDTPGACTLTIQKDGKLLGGATDGSFIIDPINYYSWGLGGTDFTLLRYDTSGQLDASFGSGGIESIPLGLSGSFGITFNPFLSAIGIQSNGKIVAAGTTTFDFIRILLARYNTDGSLDKTFASGGIDTSVITGYHNPEWGFDACAIAIQPDDKIVVGGRMYFGIDSVLFAAIRYNPDGTRDASFGTNGATVLPVRGATNSMVLQSDGKIILGGSGPLDISTDAFFEIIRLNTNGSLDKTFGNNGLISTDIFNGSGMDEDALSSIAFQSDGKLLAGGTCNIYYSYFALARYTLNLTLGVLQLSPSGNTALIYPNPLRNTETLSYTLATDETLTINLYDISGRLVKCLMTNEKVSAGEHKQELNFQSVTAGTYFIAISDSNSATETIKVVKQ